jgi:hypothetical protein
MARAGLFRRNASPADTTPCRPKTTGGVFLKERTLPIVNNVSREAVSG